MPASLAFISAITLFETRESFARHARLTSTFAYRPGLAARSRPGPASLSWAACMTTPDNASSHAPNTCGWFNVIWPLHSWRHLSDATRWS